MTDDILAQGVKAVINVYKGDGLVESSAIVKIGGSNESLLTISQFTNKKQYRKLDSYEAVEIVMAIHQIYAFLHIPWERLCFGQLL